MKTIYKLLWLWPIVLMTVACTKTTSNEGSGNNLFTEKIDSVQLNEPVLLSFSNGNNASIVSWQVTPSNGTTISKAGSYATLTFDSSGSYTIVASANNKQATYYVHVINKGYNNTGTGFSLTASNVVGAQLNESIIFTVNNASSGNLIWTASGNAGLVALSANKRVATINFTSGNTGTVTVTDGTNTQSRTIWLDNAVNNVSIDTVPFMFGDKLNITPSIVSDSMNKTLVISTKTTYNYQSNTDIILSTSDTLANNYSVSFGGVVMASIPLTNVLPATASNSFTNIPVGTYPFTVNYANQTFTGSISLNASGVYTFNWPANNYVSIYPLTLQ